MNPAAFRILAQGLATVAVVALGLLVYDRWIAQPALRIGVVDLNTVYREKEADFTRRITEARTDADRDQAMQAARTLPSAFPWRWKPCRRGANAWLCSAARWYPPPRTPST